MTPSTLLHGLLPFEHEPYFDFADPAVAAAQKAAYAKARADYAGKTFPLLMDGKKVQGDGTFTVTNPATGEKLWAFQNATAAQLNEAVAAANKAFEGWQEVDWEEVSKEGYEAIPENARTYLDYISSELDTPIYAVGVGPGREQTVVVESPFN